MKQEKTMSAADRTAVHFKMTRALEELQDRADNLTRAALAAARRRDLEHHDSLMARYRETLAELRARSLYLTIRDESAYSVSVARSYSLEMAGRLLA